MSGGRGGVTRAELCQVKLIPPSNQSEVIWEVEPRPVMTALSFCGFNDNLINRTVKNVPLFHRGVNHVCVNWCLGYFYAALGHLPPILLFSLVKMIDFTFLFCFLS